MEDVGEETVEEGSFFRGGEERGREAGEGEEEVEVESFLAKAVEAVADCGASDEEVPYFLGLPLFLRTVSGGGGVGEATRALPVTECCCGKTSGVGSEEK